MSGARCEGDTWDLASSVGVTATMVAAARAVATRNQNPLVNDHFGDMAYLSSARLSSAPKKG
jgi:O-methyltransferase involved in polyketide biosynthesis